MHGCISRGQCTACLRHSHVLRRPARLLEPSSWPWGNSTGVSPTLYWSFLIEMPAPALGFCDLHIDPTSYAHMRVFSHLRSGQGKETCDQRTHSNRQKGTEWEGQRTGKQNVGFLLLQVILIIAVKGSADVVSKALQKGSKVGDNTKLGKSLLYVATPQISLVF